MPSNVEIKAKIDDGKMEVIFEEACKVATAENGSPATVTLLEQSDTFFHCVQPGQRLKLRQQARDGVVEKAQLIVYSRPDQTGPKFCEYSIVFLDKSEAEQLKMVLLKSLGIAGEVVKKRRLVLIGQTRVHIDDVVGLGSYIELEVVMRENQTQQEGQLIAEKIMEQLNIPLKNLVAPAYVDLLMQHSNSHSGNCLH